jgi:type II secretory pathway component GspD/PulD (secretin)
MQYSLKLWPAFLAAAFFMLAGSACGRGNVELRMIKIVYGNGPSICATAQAALSPDGKMAFDLKTHTLVVFDRPDYLPHIEELVRTLDVRVPQVELSVRIAEVNGLFLKKAGIDSGQVVFSRGSFDVVSGLLNSRTDAFTRSEITLKTLSGAPAQLQVSREEIFGQAEAKDDRGRSIAYIAKKDAGDYLEVLPMANYDNTVTLKLRPSLSRVDERGAVSESAVLTQVTLHSGDMVAIGGVETQDRSPESINRRKTMIFLTATIIY